MRLRELEPDTPPETLRIAWIGPMPVDVGGVAGVSTQLIGHLAKLGHRIDCFLTDPPSTLPKFLAEQPTIIPIWAGMRWGWDRWYSKSPTGAFVTSLAARAWAFRQLRKELADRHARVPYDIIYQFSNIEVVGVPRSLRGAVPLVIHPETHIAGDLHWYRAEADLVKRCESSRSRRRVVESVLAFRTAIQRRSIRRASAVVCISSSFRDNLIRDYGIDPERTFVLPNPIDTSIYKISTEPLHDPPVLLVLGRVSVRKGVAEIVHLSHRLADVGETVTIRIVGGHTLWSDYRPLLNQVNLDNTVYVGKIPAQEVAAELASADVLVQASKYEPFGLTVGEALASGLPVVATAVVGAIEGTCPESTEVVGVGDVGALVVAVQVLLGRMSTNCNEVRQAARSDAERLFDPASISQRLSDYLIGVVESEKKHGTQAPAR